MSFFEFIKTNMMHVLPILLSGMFAFAIILDRLQALYIKYPMRDLDGFFKHLSNLVMKGKIQEGIGYCEKHSSSLVANIAKTALSRAHLPETVIEDGLQMAISDATQAIQKRTSFLATIANIATLLGLLGTIMGLIHSFEAVGHADAQQKSALLSAGIATAMNATMLGLAVAIPCMIAFSLLTYRSNRLISESENAAIRTLDILKQRFYAVPETSEDSRRSA